MPYVNEHAARIKDPKQYDSFNRKNDEFGEGIDIIYGIKDDKSEVQAIRFDAKKFTEEEAREWLEVNNYEPIEFEAAVEVEENSAEMIIENVDIWRAGNTVDGREVSKSKLEKVFQNTLAMLRAIPNFRITVKPDGHWHTSEKIIAYADNIRKVGSRIVCDIVTRSMDIVKDIKNKSFIAPSAEISKFKEYGEVISGIALIGNSIPAFPDLQGLHSAAASGDVYCMTQSDWISVEDFFSKSNKFKKVEEILMEELKKEITELKEEIKKIKAESDSFKTENDNLKKENETLKTSIDSFKKSISDKKTADISEFVSKLIEAGKVTADKKDQIITHFSQITGDSFIEDQIKTDIVYSTIMSTPEPKKKAGDILPNGQPGQTLSLFSEQLGVKKESYEAFEKSNSLKF